MTMILSCLMCFGGGVIMTSSLCHMLPDVQEVISDHHGSLNIFIACIMMHYTDVAGS